MKKVFALSIILLLLNACTPTIALKMNMPSADRAGVREFARLNNIPYRTCGEAVTVMGFVGYTHLNSLCETMGGILYMTETVTKEGFGGQKLKETTEYKYRDVSFFKLDKMDNKVICRDQKGSIIFSATRYTTGNYGTATCMVNIFNHRPEPDIPWVTKPVEENKNLPFDQFIKKALDASSLPDGSFKVSTSEDRCSPLTFTQALSRAAQYCELKGGTFKKVSPVTELYNDMICDGNFKNWASRFIPATYVCEHPSEPFTVMIEEDKVKTAQNVRFNINQIGVVAYIKQGITNGLSSAQPVSRDDIDLMILTTASTKAPQMLTKGSMNYRTTYNGSDAENCSLVSLISKVEGIRDSEKILNYRVCNNTILPVGETGGIGYFGHTEVPAEARKKATELAQTCRLYGSSSTVINGIKISCRVPNPQLPCAVEITYTEQDRLLKQEVINMCK